jgi:acetoacetyl-CoA synthetase
MNRIKQAIRTKCSPRHVPDEVLVIPSVPRTLNGKKLEVPVKKLLMGLPLRKAANPDGMSNPEALKFFVEFARQIIQPPL